VPAANRYTTTELLTSIHLKGHIPPSQTPFDDAGLLSLADDELGTPIMSLVRSIRENFYLKYQDFELNSENLYDIPTRALGGALQDVQIVNGVNVIPVGRTETNEQFATNTSPTGNYAFMLLDDKIKILPVVTAGTIRLWYMRRPNKLVATSACAQVTDIDLGTNTLTFATGTIPSTFTTEAPLDCIKDQPHFGWRFVDYYPIAIGATTVQFDSLPLNAYGDSEIEIGDWLALAGTTPVPQMIAEFWPLLVQRTVCKYYEIQGYKDKQEKAQKSLEELERKILELLNPRVSSEPKRIVPDSNIIGGYSTRWRAWRAT